MSLEGALLGLISSKGPLTGYDLTKIFRRSMSHYWHARHGQIYPTLEALRRRGWISCRKLIQRDRPNKKLYSITEKGRGELLRWLRAPAKLLPIKNEPLLKCRFYSHLPVNEAVARVAVERSQYTRLLQEYRALAAEYANRDAGYRDADEMFDFFVLQRGILFLEESIRWCDWVGAEIEHCAKVTGPKRGLRGVLRPVTPLPRR